MNEIIYQGLKIRTDCKYLYIHSGDTLSVKENKQTQTYELVFIENTTNREISDTLGIPMTGATRTLSGMTRPELFPNTTITLGGLKFKKMTYDSHIFRIVIVGDSESRVVQTYDYTTIIISAKDVEDESLVSHILYSGGLKYIVPITPKKCLGKWTWKNYPRILVHNKSLTLESDSDTIYYLRKRYDNYLIRSIDYQNQFVEEIKKILDEYGIELVRYNREQTLTRTNYVTYRFSQTPSNYLHPQRGKDDQLSENIAAHRLMVEFEFRCGNNTQMFFDFKNRYSNVDLLTNRCEFTTMDRYGSLWSFAVKWGRITEDFSQMYEQDNNQNFSLSCQFSAELYFYEVYDTSTQFIKEVIIELAENDNV